MSDFIVEVFAGIFVVIVFAGLASILSIPFLIAFALFKYIFAG